MTRRTVAGALPREGFVLVEVLVALTVLSVGVLGVAGLTSLAVRVLGEAGSLDAHVTRLEAVADSLRRHGFEAGGEGRGEDETAVVWERVEGSEGFIGGGSEGPVLVEIRVSEIGDGEPAVPPLRTVVPRRVRGGRGR